MTKTDHEELQPDSNLLESVFERLIGGSNATALPDDDEEAYCAYLEELKQGVKAHIPGYYADPGRGLTHVETGNDRRVLPISIEVQGRVREDGVIKGTHAKLTERDGMTTLWVSQGDFSNLRDGTRQRDLADATWARALARIKRLAEGRA